MPPKQRTLSGTPRITKSLDARTMIREGASGEVGDILACELVKSALRYGMLSLTTIIGRVTEMSLPPELGAP